MSTQVTARTTRNVRYLVCTSNVNLEDQVPVLILHVLEADITQDTGIVDQDMYASEALDCSLDDGLAILNTVVVCNSLSSCALDLLYHSVGGLCLVSDMRSEAFPGRRGVDIIPLTTCLHLW